MRARSWSLLPLVLLAGCASNPPPEKEKETKANAPVEVKTIPAPTVAGHPVDPLTKDEIEKATAIIKEALKPSESTRWATLVVNERPKTEILGHEKALHREAFAILADPKANTVREVVVDLDAKKVTSTKAIPGAQVALLEEEFTIIPDLVRADPAFKAAMEKRGIKDMSNVQLDVWAPGHLGSAKAPGGARLARACAFLRNDDLNPYGRPIEGVVALLDMTARKVLEIVDTGVVPVREKTQNFDPKSIGAQRPALKPMRTVLPEGPSYKLDGHEVSWDCWRFRWSFHPREGVILQLVRWKDANGTERSILHRGSLSEMVVPYSDPEDSWRWRSAFDEGEYGMGRCTTPLEPGLDAPEDATYVDTVLADEKGAPKVFPRAIAIHERDSGLLWKHMDDVTRKIEARRGRELVITYSITVGNYDYSFSWVLHQDGGIELEGELSGILLPKGVAGKKCVDCEDLAAGRNPKPVEPDLRHAHLVDEGIIAPFHQHVFSVRLDLDVEGPKNSIMELNTRSVAMGPENPSGNAWVIEKSMLTSELAARRDLSLAHARKWKIFNPEVRNELGHLSAWALIPGESTVPFLDPQAPVRKLAGFVDHHVWVTKYKAHELYAAGDYPSQGKPGQGLPEFVKDDEPIVGQDIVLWYTFGVSHGPRPEEWPVMPVHRTGFKLLPHGFFARNPALDVPPPSVGK